MAMAQNDKMLPIGTKLHGGVYEIIKHLSNGGFGNTYVVKNVSFDEIYAMKECFMKGIKRVNFYGMAGDFSPANHLLEFKSGFGIKVEEYIGGFRVQYRGEAADCSAGRLRLRIL